ncbi:MAG: AAA family ATPase [Puniceicoccaceae bacterium]
MSVEKSSLERCQSFIDSNFVKTRQEKPRKRLAITLSRQKFSKSHAIADQLMPLLQRDKILGTDHWALFDRDLVHRILEDHNLPETIARYMPEDRDHDVTGLINEILGLHPSSWKLFHYTCDTIHKLASVGNVIVIGRGSHIITRSMPHVLKVRIICPLEKRVERAARLLDLTLEEAQKIVKQDDAARTAFVRSHFDEDIADPLAYDLTINTEHLSVEDGAYILLQALRDH